MNIFNALETRFEPIFNNIKYKELEPVEVVKNLSELGLFKQVPITKASCNECPENCRGMETKYVDGEFIFSARPVF